MHIWSVGTDLYAKDKGQEYCRYSYGLRIAKKDHFDLSLPEFNELVNILGTKWVGKKNKDIYINPSLDLSKTFVNSYKNLCRHLPYSTDFLDLIRLIKRGLGLWEYPTHVTCNTIQYEACMSLFKDYDDYNKWIEEEEVKRNIGQTKVEDDLFTRKVKEVVDCEIEGRKALSAQLKGFEDMVGPECLKDMETLIEDTSKAPYNNIEGLANSVVEKAKEILKEDEIREEIRVSEETWLNALADLIEKSTDEIQVSEIGMDENNVITYGLSCSRFEITVTGLKSCRPQATVIIKLTSQITRYVSLARIGGKRVFAAIEKAIYNSPLNENTMEQIVGYNWNQA